MKPKEHRDTWPATQIDGLFFLSLASLSHWLYLWDEMLWIGGFMAIDMNLSDWRNEMVDEQAGAVAG